MMTLTTEGPDAMTTTDPTLALARRVVACPDWRWMPGMLALPLPGMVAHPVRLTDDRRVHYPEEHDWPHDMGLRLPDLTDPGTLGCLLALVREKWGPLAHLVRLGVVHQPNGPESVFEPIRLWALSVADDDKPLLLDLFYRWRYLTGPSEAAALVAALEHQGTP